MKTTEQARADLAAIMPHLRYAVSQARAKGEPKLGVLCLLAGGGGKIEAQFDAEIIDDIALALGLPAQAREDDLACAATKIAQMFSPEKP